MKIRQYPFKFLILIFFFLLLLVSVIMTSSDFRNFAYRLTNLDRESELSSKEVINGPHAVTKPIVNRQSIRIDSHEEAHSNVSMVNLDKEAEQEDYSDDNAGSMPPAMVNIMTQASVARAERQDSGESGQSPKKSFYSLHVGSFKDSAPAKTWAEQLTAMGHVAWWEKVTLPKKGDWYRVYMGKQTEKAEAVRLGEKLKDDGIINYFAIHEKNDQRTPHE